MQNSLSKAMVDLEALIDVYGKDAILNKDLEFKSHLSVSQAITAYGMD